jgi:hypothetical protein
MDRLPFRVCPDYGQFYLEDLDGPHDAPEDLDEEDFRHRFRANGRLIAVYAYDYHSRNSWTGRYSGTW